VRREAVEQGGRADRGRQAEGVVFARAAEARRRAGHDAQAQPPGAGQQRLLVALALGARPDDLQP
jgi:hypothetical protein